MNHIREYVLDNPLQWQFDRENSIHTVDKIYDKQWGPIEEVIYGKKGSPAGVSRPNYKEMVGAYCNTPLQLTKV